MARALDDTPQRIVDGGRLRAGVFRAPFHDMNLLDSNLFGGPAMRWFRRFRLKEWTHFGVIHPEWYFGMIILDAKYTATSFFFAYNRKTGEMTEYSRMKMDRAVRLSQTLWDDRSYFLHSGYRMEFHNHLDIGQHKVTVEIAATKKQPAVRADITLHEDLSKIQPLIVSLPVKPNHHMFSHKAPCAAGGTIRVGSEEIRLDPARDLALMDEHKAFYPYHTAWRWATFAGRDAHGRVVALNLTDHIIKNQEVWNENAVWVDGKLSLLGPAIFNFDPNDSMKPWTVREKYGRASLTFHPDGDKTENNNFVVLRTAYHQPFGRFRGFLVDDAGERHEINDYYGVTENMDARF